MPVGRSPQAARSWRKPSDFSRRKPARPHPGLTYSGRRQHRRRRSSRQRRRVSMAKNKHKKSSPLAVELLARTMEHQQKDEPSKLNRDRNLKVAQQFREKHLPKNRN